MRLNLTYLDKLKNKGKKLWERLDNWLFVTKCRIVLGILNKVGISTIKWKNKLGLNNEDGSPKRCSSCGGSDFKHVNVDFLDIMELEADIDCKNCNSYVGFWSYGSYYYY